jgi:cytochrome c553
MMARLTFVRRGVLPFLVIGAAACDATPPPVGMERGAELYETCLPCHGENAVGNPEIAAPAIAGLVAQFVASLDPVYPASTLHGNAGVGAASYAVCVACHGEDGLGNPDLHAPPIVQLDDWYLLNQLRNFKVGARGADPGDIWGTTMRVNSLALTDQAMQDVIAYVQTLR